MSLSALLKRMRKPKRDFPPWCADLCQRALEEARVALASKGTKLKRRSIKVEVVSGTRRFTSGWGWFVEEPSWPNGGLWVNALCSGDGGLIQIAIDPARATDQSALNYGSLVHEFAHHWLLSNGDDGWHDAQYDDVIPGWRGAREIVGKNRSMVKVAR